MKKVFDFTTALFFLLLALPIILILATVVRIYIGSPVLYSQLRPGINAKPFNIYKFRTMLLTTDKNNQLLPDENRMTALGSFLRKYSLDELPQLFNVLKGDLSLVGPRPLLMEYLPLYSPEQARRHLVKPGLTGWAQVNGRNAISWEDKFRLDVWYVEHQSFLLDMKIILLTIKKVIFHDDINPKGAVTMHKFTGSLND